MVRPQTGRAHGGQAILKSTASNTGDGRTWKDKGLQPPFAQTTAKRGRGQRGQPQSPGKPMTLTFRGLFLDIRPCQIAVHQGRLPTRQVPHNALWERKG